MRSRELHECCGRPFLNARSSKACCLGRFSCDSWCYSCRACRRPSIFACSSDIRRRELFSYRIVSRVHAHFVRWWRKPTVSLPLARRNGARSERPSAPCARIGGICWAVRIPPSAACRRTVRNAHRDSRRWASLSPNRSDSPGEAQKPASHPRRARHHLSGDIGISTALMICLVGPAALGMTSKSKMSVGSHKVAQAFGMSTTPEMWP
jgi:hypothetical protein